MKVNVLNNSGSIALRFKHNGKTIKFAPIKLGKFDDVYDYSQAMRIKRLIEFDIEQDCFDETLEKYKFDNSKKISKADSRPKATEQVKRFLLIELWDRWIKTLQLSEATKNNHYAYVRKMIVESNPIPEDATWLKDWESKLAPKTFSDRFSYLKSCLDWAIREFNLDFSNPYTDYKKPRQKAKIIKPFTLEEVSRILTAIESNQFCKSNNGYNHSHYLPLFQFLFQTGTRPGEAIGLRWQHIDFENGLIEISESLSRDLAQGNGSKRVRKETKTGNVRFLPMSDKLKAILTNLKGLDNASDDLVFVSPKGDKKTGSIDPSNLSDRVWRPVLSGLGLEYRPLYQTRHTFLSHAVMNPDIGLLGAAQLAGHTDARMVSKHYARFAGQAKAPELL